MWIHNLIIYSTRFSNYDTIDASTIKLNLKSNITYVDAACQAINNKILLYETIAGADIKLSTKADKTDTYPKAEVNNAIAILQAGIDRRSLITEVYNKGDIDLKCSSLIGSSPEILNTIVELSNALSNDANYATTLQNQLNNKADKLNTFTKMM